jgi:hypothetical protein
MTLRIRTITVDCRDWQTQVHFWSKATDLAENPDNPNSPGDPEGLLTSPDGRINLLFIPVPEGKQVKNRVHLDLTPVDGTRDEEVERLLGLGATLFADHREADGSGWLVLQDPEGNEFCVERSEAERAGPG